MEIRSFLFGIIPALAVLYYLSDYSAMYDFSRLWKSSAELLSRRNPFDLPPVYQYNPNLKEGTVEMPFFWPPVWFLPFLPFGFFSLKLAKVLFLWSAALAVGFAIVRCRRWFFPAELRGSALVLALLFPLGAVINGIVWGSPSWLVLAGLMLAVHHVERGRSCILGGLGLFLMGTKIHLGVAPILFIIGHALRVRNFGICISSLGWIGFSFLLCLGLYPDIFAIYLDRVQSMDFTLASLENASPIKFLLVNQGWSEGLLLTTPSLILASLSLVMGWACSADYKGVLAAVVLPLNFILSAYVWPHDGIVLTFSVLWFAGTFLHKRKHLSVFEQSAMVVPLLFANIFATFSGAALQFPDKRFIPLYCCVAWSTGWLYWVTRVRESSILLK